jgi:hypothetical protein
MQNGDLQIVKDFIPRINGCEVSVFGVSSFCDFRRSSKFARLECVRVMFCFSKNSVAFRFFRCAT